MCKGDVTERRPDQPCHQGFQRSLRPLLSEEICVRLLFWLVNLLCTLGILLDLSNTDLDLWQSSRLRFYNVALHRVVKSPDLRIWR